MHDIFIFDSRRFKLRNTFKEVIISLYQAIRLNLRKGVNVMNEAMKINNIEDYMESLTIPVNQNFVYGYTEPGLLSSFTYGALASLVDMKFYLLFFSSDEIILVGLTMMGQFSGDHARIPYEDIDYLKVKKGLVQYKITIKIKGEKKLTFKSNKVIAGIKWQKNNLAFLDSTNWYNSKPE